MATAAVEISTPLQSRWIISAKTDLMWFSVGGVAAAYLFWALWRFAHAPLPLLVAI